MTQAELIQQLSEHLASLKRIMMRSREQMLGELQLTRTQIEVIMLLCERNSQTVGELAGSLAVTNSASTQTIETLVRRDLVERVTDDSDRRIVRIHLSQAGQNLAAELQRGRLERIRQAFASLTETELTTMITALKRVEQQFDTSQKEEEK